MLAQTQPLPLNAPMGKHTTTASLLIAFGYLFAAPLAAQDKTPAHPLPSKEDLTYLAGQLRERWEQPPNADNVRISVILKLKRDGTLEKEPEIKSVGDKPASDEIIESVRRAIQKALPFKLSAANYESWKELSLVFKTDNNSSNVPPSGKPAANSPAAPPPPTPPKPPAAPQS